MYTLHQRHIKKFRMKTVFDKLPEGSQSLFNTVNLFLDSNEPENRQVAIKNMNLMFTAARKIFAKMNTVITLDDSSNSCGARDTARCLETGHLDYHAAYLIAFEYAAIKYMLRTQNESYVDMGTYAIIVRSDTLMDFELEDEDTSDFDAITQEMLNELDGSGGRAIGNIRNVLPRTDFMLFLLLPQLDNSIARDHRAIYKAIVDSDVAAFNAVLDAP